MRNALWLVLGIFLVSTETLAQTSQRVLPEKNELALTAENFCLGFKNMFAITKQDFQEEADYLCPSLAPSDTLRTLIAQPYTGAASNVRNLVVQPEGGLARIVVAYSMRVPHSPVAALLNEEKHVSVSYARDILRIMPEFGPPARNMNDADTAFEVRQRTLVNGRVAFDDRSVHDLKLYRLHPNNFDFFAAVRTLREPSQQFRRATVLRGIMRDPTDPESTLSITVMQFLMNNRGQYDQVVNTFLTFIQDDMRQLYSEQIQSESN